MLRNRAFLWLFSISIVVMLSGCTMIHGETDSTAPASPAASTAGAKAAAAGSAAANATVTYQGFHGHN